MSNKVKPKQERNKWSHLIPIINSAESLVNSSACLLGGYMNNTIFDPNTLNIGAMLLTNIGLHISKINTIREVVEKRGTKFVNLNDSALFLQYYTELESISDDVLQNINPRINEYSDIINTKKQEIKQAVDSQNANSSESPFINTPE